MSVDFIGIGTRKAATSWLAKMLNEHPSICVAHGKETHFFSNDALFAKGKHQYLSSFKHCGDGCIRGEYSVSYFNNKKAAGRIHKWNPAVKILVVLRDPIERTISDIHHLRAKGRFGGDISVREVIRQYPDIIEKGLYGKHLPRWFDLFPTEQMLILEYKDIQQNPRRVMHRVYAFLGVDAQFIPPGLKTKYQSYTVRSSSLFRWMNKIYLKIRCATFGRLLVRLLRFLGVNAYRMNTAITFMSRKQKEDIAEEDIQYLHTLFEEDQRLLAALLVDKKVSL